MSSHLLRLIVPLAWLALAVGLAGQAPVFVPVELGLAPVQPGGRVELTIRIPDTGIANPEVILPDFPPRVSYLSGPVITQDAGLDDAGKRTRFLFLAYSFRANSSGYVEFPSFTINYGTQTFRTNPVLAGIGLESDPKVIPPDLVWNIRSTRVFEGQAVYLTLDLRFAQTITFPDKVEVAPAQGGLFEEVTGLGQIETEKVGGKEFSRIPVATFIFTPATKGNVLLPVARITYGSRILNSQAGKVQVEPLPIEVGSSGAIGELRFSAFLDKDKIGLDEQFLLTMRVEGDGNFNFLHIPEPILTDLVLIGKSDNAKFTASESGYRGFRESVYRLSAIRLGAGSIGLPAFNWINPQGLVQSHPASSLVFSVNPAGSAQANHLEANQGQPLTADAIDLLQPRYLYQNPIGILFYLPGLILLISALVRNWRKRQVVLLLSLLVVALLVTLGIVLRPVPVPAGADWRQLITSGNARFAAKDFQAANSDYTKALAIQPDSPGIMYNLAISCFEKNANAQGMFYLQKAVRLVPDNQRLRLSLKQYETALGLDRQLPVYNLPTADSLFLAAAVFLALGGVFLVLGRRYRSIGLLGASLFLLVALGCGSGFLADWLQIKADVGIISETGGAIRKIPDKAATEWLTLKGGTSVLTLASSGNFRLVETAYGVKGWLDSSTLYSAPAALK